MATGSIWEWHRKKCYRPEDSAHVMLPVLYLWIDIDQPTKSDASWSYIIFRAAIFGTLAETNGPYKFEAPGCFVKLS
ncbi:putative MFS-type transporter C16A3.17c [Fusarium oxysporum f. sp. albedinis]|nr:putative MFS-type transporter C16A3.17c [Fusarium oxysporum f. sp. albedinis]